MIGRSEHAAMDVKQAMAYYAMIGVKIVMHSDWAWQTAQIVQSRTKTKQTLSVRTVQSARANIVQANDFNARREQRSDYAHGCPSRNHAVVVV